MKIIRVIDDHGATTHAVLHADGTATALDGDILNSWSDSGRSVTPIKRLAPLAPAALICIGLNYRHHAEEAGAKIPEYPIVFLKSPNALQNPLDPIELPVRLKSDQVDYEAELAVVIGKRCKNVTAERALDYVLGYTCANDVSARDWQMQRGGGQWSRGKSFDTFAPLGPAIVTKDDIPNPNKLHIRALLNGESVQDANTADMIFDVPALISFLSAGTTLLPGTVILTGTPHGVGMGRKPPLWLKAGDTITVAVDGIGELTNPVIDEPSA